MKTIRIIFSMMIITTLLTSTAFAQIDFDKVEDLKSFIQTYYYKDIEESILDEGVYQGVFDNLDPHSTYFTKEEMRSFMDSNSGSFAGIGASLSKKDDYIEIISVFASSPASKAGLKEGDIITEVDGISIKNMDIDLVVAKIKGIKGSNVKLKIRRGNESLIFNIIRDTIIIETVTYTIRTDNIAVMKISQFAKTTYDDFYKTLEEIRSRKVKGVVIDIRNNPGGYLDVVEKMSDLLLKEGNIVYIDYKAFPDETVSADQAWIDIPVVLLINEFSASASEIFSSSLQENGRAKLVGNTTYGKGTVQTVQQLSDGSGYKVTIAEYLSGLQTKIDGVGVKPDYEVTIKDLTNITLAPFGEYDVKNFTKPDLNVYALQQRLDLIGYIVPKDGILGTQTLKALNNYRSINKLPIYSYLDIASLKLIDGVAKIHLDKGYIDTQLNKAIELLKGM